MEAQTEVDLPAFSQGFACEGQKEHYTLHSQSFRGKLRLPMVCNGRIENVRSGTSGNRSEEEKKLSELVLVIESLKLSMP